MADQKITQLTELTTPDNDDMLAIVDDPAGTPVTKKIKRWRAAGRYFGTGFPGSPATGDICYRTDRNIEYFYDGTRWLSTTLYTLAINGGTIGGTTVTTTFYAANPWWNQYDIYVERFKVNTVQTTTTASNYFTHQFGHEDGASSTNVGSAISGQNNTQNQFVGQEVTINAVVASTVDILKNTATETGTSSTWITSAITYRLIG